MIRGLSVTALAVALAGCGGGGGSGGPVSAGTNTESNVTTVVRDGMAWAKKLTRSRDQQWERTMPLPTMVFQTANKELQRLTEAEGWPGGNVNTIACALAGGALTVEDIRRDTAAAGEDLEALKKHSLALKALLEGDTTTAGRHCMLGRMKAFATPVSGWPGGFGQRAENMRSEFAGGIHSAFLALPEFVGRVVSDVEGLGDGVPQGELESAIVQAIYKHQDFYWTLSKQNVQQNMSGKPAHLNLDYSGKSSAAVHFIADGNIDYQGGPQGWQITQHGAPWLSGTHVLGNTVTLAVNISDAASMEKSSTNENTRDGTAIDRSTQGVDIK